MLHEVFDFLSGHSVTSVDEGLESTVEHSWHWPAWAKLLLIIVGCLWVGWLYARESGLSHSLRLLLTGLRVALLGIVVLMLFGWTQQRHRTDLPDLALVIDDSGSMAIVDDFEEAARQETRATRAAAAGFSNPSRLNLVKTLLLEKDAALLRTLQERYHLKLFLIGSSARPQGFGTEPLAALVHELTAEESASRLGKGVLDILQSQRGRPTAGILGFTDGATTEGKSLGEVAEQVRRKQVPLILVGMGNDQPPRDLQLADLLVEDVAFVNDQLHFDAKLQATGFAGQTVTVRVRQQGVATPLGETTVTINRDGESQPVRVTIRPREKGTFDFILEAEPLPGEVSTTNNAVARTFTVSEETIRVLFAQGDPSYEFRYLKSLLSRELKSDSTKAEKAFSLRTVLQEADLEYAQQDETAERVFPVSQDELFQYDVVIFGDCNPAFFSPSVLSNVVDFVRVRGGSVIFLAGPRFMPLAFRDSPLAELLPVTLDTVSVPDGNELTEHLQPRPSALGNISPQLQLAESVDGNLQAWRSLPGIYWWLETPDLRPGARVLVEHSTRNGNNGQPLPLITLQFIGAGKIVFHATDETWRWSRSAAGEQYYSRYWLQTLRYLSRSRLLGRSRGAQLATDRELYQYGEAAQLRVRFFDERLAPTRDDVTVVLEREGSGKRNIALARDTTQRGFFTASVTQLEEGAYRAWLASPTLDGQPPSARFTVVAPLGEQSRRQMDATDLRAAAKTTAGQFFTFDNAHELLQHLPTGHQVRIESLPPVPLWNLWPLPTLFVILLVTEWLLRKRAGLV